MRRRRKRKRRPLLPRRRPTPPRRSRTGATISSATTSRTTSATAATNASSRTASPPASARSTASAAALPAPLRPTVAAAAAGAAAVATGAAAEAADAAAARAATGAAAATAATGAAAAPANRAAAAARARSAPCSSPTSRSHRRPTSARPSPRGTTGSTKTGLQNRRPPLARTVASSRTSASATRTPTAPRPRARRTRAQSAAAAPARTPLSQTVATSSTPSSVSSSRTTPRLAPTSRAGPRRRSTTAGCEPSVQCAPTCASNRVTNKFLPMTKIYSCVNMYTIINYKYRSILQLASTKLQLAVPQFQLNSRSARIISFPRSNKYNNILQLANKYNLQLVVGNFHISSQQVVNHLSLPAPNNFSDNLPLPSPPPGTQPSPSIPGIHHLPAIAPARQKGPSLPFSDCSCTLQAVPRSILPVPAIQLSGSSHTGTTPRCCTCSRRHRSRSSDLDLHLLLASTTAANRRPARGGSRVAVPCGTAARRAGYGPTTRPTGP